MTDKALAALAARLRKLAQAYRSVVVVDVTSINEATDLERAADLIEQRGEPVAAQHRFRHPQKGTPDWSVWQPCAVNGKRPAWEIDSQGYEVEYRALYLAPPAREPVVLPPLPHPLTNIIDGDDWSDVFTADQMHDYARAALAQYGIKEQSDE